MTALAIPELARDIGTASSGKLTAVRQVLLPAAADLDVPRKAE